MVLVEVTGSHLPDFPPQFLRLRINIAEKKNNLQINTCKISLALPSNINEALKQIFPLSGPEVLKLCAAVAAASPEGDDFQELSENSEEDEGGREKKKTRTCCQPARQIPDLPQHIPGIPTCVSPPLDERRR